MSVQPSAETIFANAIEIDSPTERAAYLEEACQHNAYLRRTVEKLVSDHMRVGEFLERPAACINLPTIDQTPVDHPETQIGPYKLIEQIGEGGMGTVWMAQQLEPVRRLVAVKVIKPGMDSRQVIARFEAERQALALMDHANIAKVLDAGTTNAGRPYFVMDLVRGVPITQYCDEHHLTTMQRLELFIPVCQAIQHAHQKGIIHRDLKPSNVLVALYDGQPVPKVIDFGVAKAAGQLLTEQTLVTGYGNIVGTLEYMSPEQAEVNQFDVDTRSDIYSLGVLLYELLTGSPPFSRKELENAGMLEMLRVIREQEPSKPSTKLSTTEGLPTLAANRGTDPAKLTKLVRGELDWIVMRALEKDRNRRYETANGFAMDVQRYLDDEPVQACPPSLRYRLRKFVRRYKVAIAFTGLVLLILLSLAGGIGWNVRDRTARQAALEQEVNLAMKDAERMQHQEKWSEALSAVRRAEGLLAGTGSDELRERVRLLRKDLEMVQRLEDIPLLYSNVTKDGFDYEKADRAFERAFVEYGIDVQKMPAEESGARIRARAGVAAALVTALDDWGFVRFQSDRAGGLALLDVAQVADQDSWRQQLREATRRRDGKKLAALVVSPEFSHQPPGTLVRLARALRDCGHSESRMTVLRQAQCQYPGDFWTNYDLAAAHSKLEPSQRDKRVSFLRAALAVRPLSVAVHTDLGCALQEAGELEEAIDCYRKAIEIDRTVALPHFNLGLALTKKRAWDEALVCFKEAVRLDPNNAPAHGQLGILLGNEGLLDDAIVCLRTSIRLAPDDATGHTWLGDTLRQQGKLDEALAACQRAVDLAPKLAQAHNNLGRVLVSQGKVDEAIAAYREAIRLEPDFAEAHTNLGRALDDKGLLDESIAAHREVLRLRPKEGRAYANLCVALFKKGKLNEAIDAGRQAVRLQPDDALAHDNLGAVLFEKGLLDEAIVALREAIRLDPRISSSHYNLGNVLIRKGQVDDAIAVYRDAIRLNRLYDAAHNNLGAALVMKGAFDEAIVAYREAIRLQPKNQAALNNLARLLALCPNPKLRDPDRAVELAKKAVALAPEEHDYWNTLGIAHYRTGHWKDAIAALQQSIPPGNRGNGFVQFVLAMAHWQLGEKEQARKWYDQAVEWMDTNQSKNEELMRFRAEAEELLGLKQKEHNGQM